MTLQPPSSLNIYPLPILNPPPSQTAHNTPPSPPPAPPQAVSHLPPVPSATRGSGFLAPFPPYSSSSAAATNFQKVGYQMVRGNNQGSESRREERGWRKCIGWV